MDPFAIETFGLTRRFGACTAVDDVSLRVPAGRVCGLLGANGAGKTTLFKMLTTLLPPSAGGARVAGHDLARDPFGVRRSIGYVAQMLSSDGELTGFENLLLSARLYRIPASERRPRIADALAFMELADVADRLVATYSGGMIRRLELAQAFLHRPPVLFLDEPTVGLDPAARRGVWQRIRDLRARYGTTILMSTHDMEEAYLLCEQFYFLRAGRVCAAGTARELMAQTGTASLADVFVALIGDRPKEENGYAEAAHVRRTVQRL